MQRFKNFIARFSGYIALACALVAFIIMLAADYAVHYENGVVAIYNFTPQAVLFGSGSVSVHYAYSLSISFNVESWTGLASGAALTAWIFILLAMVWHVVRAILIRVGLKKRFLAKYTLLIRAVNFLVAFMMITAGILLLVTNTNFLETNGFVNGSSSLEGGYIVAAVLTFLSAFFSLFAVSNMLSNKMRSKLGF